MKAIAAMARNRVIGADGGLPWHLPDDFRWFKKMTEGQAVLMGRKTFESLGKPLPNRLNLVVTTSRIPIPGTTLIHDLADFDPDCVDREVWVIGGAKVYEQLLPRCTDLYLSLVHRDCEGDAFFPPFEDRFTLQDCPLEHPEFTVQHYVALSPSSGGTEVSMPRHTEQGA